MDRPLTPVLSVRPRSQSECIASYPDNWTYNEFTASDFASKRFIFDKNLQAPGGPEFLICTFCEQRSKLSRNLAPQDPRVTPSSASLHKRGPYFCNNFDEETPVCYRCNCAHIILHTACCGYPVSICSQYLRDLRDKQEEAANDVDVHDDGVICGQNQHFRMGNTQKSLSCPRCNQLTDLLRNELNIDIRAE